MRRLPWFVAAPAAAGIVVFVLLPLVALAQRAPWSTIGAEIASAEVATTLRLSLLTSIVATAVAAAFGAPIAWLLARGRFKGRGVVRGLVMLPLVLPPVVGGVALLLAFGRRGLAGRLLDDAFGVTLPFTTGGAILAESFVALPFFVLAVEAALRGLDPRFEQAAATLGAGPARIMRRVTIPMIAPALAAGAALAWARALGEFGATITFAGSLPGRTQTVPLAVYEALETRPEAAIALSLLLVAVSVGVLALAGRRAFEGRLR